MSLKFSTKANTLAQLEHVLKAACVLPLHVFTVETWEHERSFCLTGVPDKLGESPWIVRSSCEREDRVANSNAGAFLSIPNVDMAGLEQAVGQVIASYQEAQPTDQVLIQSMLTNVVRSGVVFSHDPNTSAPYRIVNWSEGNDTSVVTRGAGGSVWQQAACSAFPPPPIFASIINLLEELLSLFEGAPLDFEFAVTLEEEGERLWLLQVRPLVLVETAETEVRQANRLVNIHRKVSRGMAPHPLLKGSRTVYGVMPDWNPAEIIGIRPKPLALSLYRELITDNIWAYQRNNYGYRNLRSFPLMPTFYGLPYIDVRLSFNSFIPADLDERLAGRLVDHYIERLLGEPTLHDKVEFEIVFSCYTFDLSERLGRLKKAGFSPHDCEVITSSLRNLTNHIVDSNDGLWLADAAKISTLNQRRDDLLGSNLEPLERIYWLLEHAKRYGTLPFAGLARAGFIAVQILRSLVAVGVFSQSDYDAFMAGVSTVSGQLARDRCNLDKVTFLSRYGHLRPGTYDILSRRYDEDPELYFNWNEAPPNVEPASPFTLTLPQMREISKLLEAHGLQTDPVGLLDFMQAAIELRESAKFNFTRNISDALALMAEVGSQHGFRREDLAYSSIRAFQELHISVLEPEKVLASSIDQGKEAYQETLKVVLPPLITKPEDVWSFAWPDTAPNFITQNQVTAEVVDCNARDQLAGAIVCIPSADPGFDWLFSYPIAGLITAWGGSNSHMAIRAGELRLPAVIGAGEICYRRWSSARRLFLDCAGRRVEILQ